MFGSQSLPAASAYTPSPALLLPTRAARGPCSPLRRQWPSRRATAACAATASTTGRGRTVYIAAMATGRFRRFRKYRGSGGNEVRGPGPRYE